jgi:hypothetical protein
MVTHTKVVLVVENFMDMANLNGKMEHYIEEIILEVYLKVTDSYLMLKIQVFQREFGNEEF